MIDAGPAAVALLAALHDRAMTPAWAEAEFAALLASPGVFGRIWLDKEQPSGFVLVRTAADEAEVLTLAVDPSHRRRGGASALMEAAAEAAEAAGAKALILEVAQDNAPARSLYTRLGFAEVGRRRGYYSRQAGPAGDALVLRLDLAAAARVTRSAPGPGSG